MVSWASCAPLLVHSSLPSPASKAVRSSSVETNRRVPSRTGATACPQVPLGAIGGDHWGETVSEAKQFTFPAVMSEDVTHTDASPTDTPRALDIEYFFV